MYYKYFGLVESPFSISVNPRYLFMSPRHRDALAHLLYGVGSGGGFILLTGEVGTGKTTINRALLEQLPGNVDLAIVLNPALSAVELLATVCDELAIDYPKDDHSLKDLTDALHRFLLNNHDKGRKTVLMIDEAQHLDFDVLEQIRLLTNLETDSEKLLQIILIGQPELTEKLGRPELRQLNQRITARYNLEALSLEETNAYIRHRLQVAGLPSGRELFAPGVVRAIHKRAQGIPRQINLLCDRALLGAYGRKLDRVNRRHVAAAAEEVFGTAHASVNRSSVPPWLWIFSGVCFGGLLLLLAVGFRAGPSPMPVHTAADNLINDASVNAADSGTDTVQNVGARSEPQAAGWMINEARAPRAAMAAQ
jgi:general secretion pathway protein A